MLPRLHIVTDDDVLRLPAFDRIAARLIALSPQVALHVRGHGTPAARLWYAAAKLAAIPQPRGWLVVNDRVDVALAAGADGIQLGTRSLPVGRARAQLPAGIVIGFSAHSPAEAFDAEVQGADFLMIGSIHRSGTHTGEAGGGSLLIREVQKLTIRPIIAIGGITEDNMPDVRAAGAHGIAVIGAVWRTDHPLAAAVRLLRAMGIEPENAGFTDDQDDDGTIDSDYGQR